MSTGVLITTLIGIVTTFSSAWVSWFFTRKKYNSEVDHTIIVNMQKSLEFYRQLSDDNKSRLDNMLARNKELEDELKILKQQVAELMVYNCRNLTCLNRLK